MNEPAKYSQDETPAFVSRMDEWLASIASLLAGKTGSNYSATLLMGGFARGWGAFIETPDGPTPCNDIDIALVTKRRLPPEDLAALRSEATALVNPESQHMLSDISPLDLHVDVLNFTTGDLRSLPPSQFHFDLVNASRLIDGDDVLPGARRLTKQDLDTGDALLSICNNSFSVSESLAIPGDDDAHRRLNVLIFATKASIAAGIAVTIVDGSYTPDPAERVRRIARIASGSLLGSAAPAFHGFVEEATTSRGFLSDERQANAAHFVRTAAYTTKAAAAYLLCRKFGMKWLSDPAELADAIVDVWTSERLSKPRMAAGARVAGAAKGAARRLLGRGRNQNWKPKAMVYSAALPMLAALTIQDDLSFEADDRLTGHAHGLLAAAGAPVTALEPCPAGWIDTAQAMVSALKRQNWIK